MDRIPLLMNLEIRYHVPFPRLYQKNFRDDAAQPPCGTTSKSQASATAHTTRKSTSTTLLPLSRSYISQLRHYHLQPHTEKHRHKHIASPRTPPSL
ncbi:hypothetical protein MRB53_037884 [Persea americana]|nr:hypothetical protein MRB53_037884 [Persea americana]